MLFASWQVSITTNVIKEANSYVLLAVAAAVIGGTSLFGGRGKTIRESSEGWSSGASTTGLSSIRSHIEWINDVVVALVLLAAGTIDVLSRRGSQTRAWTPTNAPSAFQPGAIDA